ncbi:MAG: hypothetical protein EAZ27_01755 [Cytophagales bacterium]|nr:MAG: hypothetical protein EAZ27_01755 [Cytophagales bacterium]
MIKVILDKKSYWFDPTITFQRGKFGFTYMPNYSIGLILKSNSTNLEQIEQSTYTRLETDYYYEIPNLIDSTRLFIETRYYGYEADYIRNFLNNTSKQNIDKYYLETISNIHPEVKTTIPTRHSDDVIKNVIVIYENYLIGNFWSQSNKTDTNQFSSIFKAKKISDALYLPQSKIRTLPLMVYSYPTVYKENIHISLPFKINIDTSTFTDITKYFSFSMQAKQPDKTNISLIYNYSTLASFVEINDFKKHVISVNNLSNYLLYNVFFTKNSENSNLNEGRIAAWVLLFFTITLFILFILASVYVNKKYNPTSIYFDQIAEPIPFKMYLIIVTTSIIIFIKIISIVIIFMQSDFLYLNLFSKESLSFNPSKYFLLHFSYILDIFFIVLGVFCIYQFYKKRYSTLFYLKLYFLALQASIIILFSTCFALDILDLISVLKTISITLLIFVPILIYIYTFNNYESVFINSYKPKKAKQEGF